MGHVFTALAIGSLVLFSTLAFGQTTNSQSPHEDNGGLLAGIGVVLGGAAAGWWQERRKRQLRIQIEANEEAADEASKKAAEAERLAREATKKAAATEARVDKEWAESMTRPVRLPPRAKRNSVILVALGGTGKTMLIRQLLKDPNANPQKRTEDYALYHGERANDGDPFKYHLYVSDYKGQNIGTLVRAFVLQQKERWSPMAYGFINTLVLMVDAFPPPDDPADDEPRGPGPIDERRIRAHIAQWSEPALDAVFGLLTRRSLKYVCFFVNKCDLLSNGDGNRAALEAAFSSLRTDLRRRAKAQDAEFDVIFGSAGDGAGVPKLEDALMRVATENEQL